MSLLSTFLLIAQDAGEHGAEAAKGAAEHGGEGAQGAAHGAEEEHKSELPFFLLGGLLAAFAVAISVFGFKRPDFPASEGQARGVMAVSVALVAAAAVAIVYVSA